MLPQNRSTSSCRCAGSSPWRPITGSATSSWSRRLRTTGTKHAPWAWSDAGRMGSMTSAVFAITRASIAPRSGLGGPNWLVTSTTSRLAWAITGILIARAWARDSAALQTARIRVADFAVAAGTTRASLVSWTSAPSRTSRPPRITSTRLATMARWVAWLMAFMTNAASVAGGPSRTSLAPTRCPSLRALAGSGTSQQSSTTGSPIAPWACSAAGPTASMHSAASATVHRASLRA
mmetsp:Transcript_175869/g.563872  ORF Transcript_175869/g.563872 Transcript_175869/m.563872 type:complete len:235 (-) Transcript_175869:572-1276(-)